MDIATDGREGQGGQGQERRQERQTARPRGLLRHDLQARHGAALGGAEGHHPGASRRRSARRRSGASRTSRPLRRRGGLRHLRRGGRRAACWCWRTRCCAASRASPNRSTPACSSSCRARSRRRTATPRRRSASSSTARAPTPRSTARRPSWRRGDFVLTPYWTIHDHGNTSKKSMMWLDVLDVPTVNFFETSFYEHFDEETQNTKRDRRATR